MQGLEWICAATAAIGAAATAFGTGEAGNELTARRSTAARSANHEHFFVAAEVPKVVAALLGHASFWAAAGQAEEAAHCCLPSTPLARLPGATCPTLPRTQRNVVACAMACGRASP
jgi:hypothetical protein